jgi:hypothetical protein
LIRVGSRLGLSATVRGFRITRRIILRPAARALAARRKSPSTRRWVRPAGGGATTDIRSAYLSRFIFSTTCCKPASFGDNFAFISMTQPATEDENASTTALPLEDLRVRG